MTCINISGTSVQILTSVVWINNWTRSKEFIRVWWSGLDYWGQDGTRTRGRGGEYIFS